MVSLERPVRLATLNVRGLADRRRQRQLYRLVVEQDLDIIAVQETKVESEDRTEFMDVRATRLRLYFFVLTDWASPATYEGTRRRDAHAAELEERMPSCETVRGFSEAHCPAHREPDCCSPCTLTRCPHASRVNTAVDRQSPDADFDAALEA
ncbi:hypothetical protein HPB47_021866 [Ixodes persulcatus]|uniref:Uncharacterized protein n=1 Tax=Ixodes persulcatus TaxID=34615 RepID=A0AC60QBP2_IXOPE|nr:hypothetical protein HPB47_021866 [Ixodes persulcatus]